MLATGKAPTRLGYCLGPPHRRRPSVRILPGLKSSKVFSKMDIQWGYNNIQIKKGDEWKAVFRMNKGLFEPTVMFFGLTNSPATFQAFMNHIL